jgi:hypothetical protein
MVFPQAALLTALVLLVSSAIPPAAPRARAPAARANATTEDPRARWKPWDLKPPAPLADGRAKEIEGWKDVSCTRCHEAIAREWAGSLHAIAWVDERFQEQVADMKRPDSCYGCHAPEALAPTAVDGKLPQKPKPRDVAAPAAAENTPRRDLDAHFGVTCASCHAGKDGAMLGPFGAPTKAHASARSDLFLESSKSELCIACHATNVGPVIGIAKDFADTNQAAPGKSCIGCHMQPLERSIAIDDAGKPLPARAGRSHALQSPRDPAFLKRAFALEARERDGAVVLLVKNECGHRVPGLTAQRITLDAELFDASGTSRAKAQLVIEKRASLPVDGTLEMPLPGRGSRVVVKGTFDTPGFDQALPFLDTTLTVAP